MDFRLLLVTLLCLLIPVSSNCKVREDQHIDPQDGSLKCINSSWMNSITYEINNGNYVNLKKANCVLEYCCEKLLEDLEDRFVTRNPNNSLDYYGRLPMGEVLVGYEFLCIKPGHKISKTSAKCVNPTDDGSGWDLLSSDEVCKPCPKGSHYEKISKTCLPCPLNTYSNNTASSSCTPCNSNTSYTSDTGATQCECKRGYFYDKNQNNCLPCPLNTYRNDTASSSCTPCNSVSYTSAPGATQCECKRGLLRNPGSDKCEFCPAGHTTYRSHPGVCVGPQLYGLSLNRDYLATFVVSLHNLGNWDSAIYRWQSSGDWYIKKMKENNSTRRYPIKQRFTLSRRGYAKGVYSFRRSHISHVEPLITNKYCYTGGGENYTGYANTTVTGERCTGPIQSCRHANNGRACYCRHNSSYSQPVCQTATGDFEHCDIPKCRTGEEDVISNCNYASHNVSEDQLLQDTDSLQGLNWNEAEEACDRMGRECKGIWSYLPGKWRLSSVEAELLTHGVTELWSKNTTCQPYYQQFFTQTFQE